MFQEQFTDFIDSLINNDADNHLAANDFIKIIHFFITAIHKHLDITSNDVYTETDIILMLKKLVESKKEKIQSELRTVSNKIAVYENLSQTLYNFNEIMDYGDFITNDKEDNILNLIDDSSVSIKESLDMLIEDRSIKHTELKTMEMVVSDLLDNIIRVSEEIKEEDKNTEEEDSESDIEKLFNGIFSDIFVAPKKSSGNKLTEEDIASIILSGIKTTGELEAIKKYFSNFK